MEWTISGWMLDKISVLDSGELTEALDRQESCSGGSRRRWIVKNIVLEGSRRRRVEKNKGSGGLQETLDGQKSWFGGSGRRWIIKNIVLEGSRRPRSRKLVFWRPPGGVGSTKIVFGGCQEAAGRATGANEGHSSPRSTGP